MGHGFPGSIFRADVPDLVRHFFLQEEQEGLPAKQIDAAALDRLGAAGNGGSGGRAGS